MLEVAETVRVIGPTGSGKTTFFYQDFMRAEALRDKVAVYSEATDLKRWLTDTSSCMSVLIVDEASTHFHAKEYLKGIRNNPPAILFEGSFYHLTKSHKIIFLDNP